MDRARDLYPTIRDQRWIDATTLVFRAISALQRVHSKSELNLFNLESLFTTFEMAATLGHLPDLSADEISKLVEALQTVIVFTLDYSMRFPLNPKEGFIASPAYRQLASRLHNFKQQNSSVAVITFDYDLGFELALYTARLQFSYCLDGSQPQRDVIPLLKLHGSINWGATNSQTDAPIKECPIAWLDSSDYWQICLAVPIETYAQGETT